MLKKRHACSFEKYLLHVDWNQAITRENRLTQYFSRNEQIKAVDCQKLLGIIIDKSLTWDKQIDAVCLNVTRRITLLRLLSKYVDQNSLKLYYKSYRLPIFDYGCLIMGTLFDFKHKCRKEQQNNTKD